MSTSFANVPSAALSQPTPFKVAYHEEQLEEFHQLLKLSKVGLDTYEGLQKDRKYGITTQWLREAKTKWESFNWSVNLNLRYCDGD